MRLLHLDSRFFRSIRCFVVYASAGLATFSNATIAAGSSGFANGVAIQRDGKILVAGYATVGRSAQVALVRYNSDGSPDTSLNNSGKLTTAVGKGDCRGQGVALQDDGKIIVAGYSFDAHDQALFTVLRYRPDGSLDSSFGDAGKVTTSLGTKSATAKSVAIQSDGKIVVAGDSFIENGKTKFAVVRYKANGTLDLSFNKTGNATADFGRVVQGRSLALHSDGRIVVAGYATDSDKEEFAVACFKPEGSLDTSFNQTGKVTTDFGGNGKAEGQGAAVQADGKIVVVGYATSSGIQQFALARYNADGTLDSSFGEKGRLTTTIGNGGSNATAVALQKDGKIVVAGYAVRSNGTGYEFVCVRYNDDGSLDQGFGNAGKITTGIGKDDAKGNAVALQTDGKIVVAGHTSYREDYQIAVARYIASGKLDPSFNATGTVLTAIGNEPPEEETAAAPRPTMAIINDPDGYTNVRDSNGKVIAKVKKDEHFIALKQWNQPDDSKWSVRLKSGITGFMDRSRIRLLPDEPLMKLNYDAAKKEWRKSQSDPETEQGETAAEAKRHGFKYYDVLTAASNGDKKALAQFFSLAQSMDGAAAEGYYPDAWALFHVVGDTTFAQFLRGLPVDDVAMIRGSLGDDPLGFSMTAGVDYLQRYFPETTKILFRGEIVDWSSPDGRYSIRKTFTNPLDLTDSKVSHAELIEKATGQTLCDLTGDDIGAGGDREGSVLWSPDSKRFAYVSSDRIHSGSLSQNPPPPPERTQTTVYQSSGKSFTKIDLPLDKPPPGKESDAEIKGAVMGHEFVTPARWANANTLVLERHDYYHKLTLSPVGSKHDFGRLYEITVSFKDDGTTSTAWKLRENQ